MAARAAAEEAQTWFLRFFRLAHLTPQRLLRACYSGLWKSTRAHKMKAGRFANRSGSMTGTNGNKLATQSERHEVQARNCGQHSKDLEVIEGYRRLLKHGWARSI